MMKMPCDVRIKSQYLINVVATFGSFVSLLVDVHSMSVTMLNPCKESDIATLSR